MTDKIKTYSIIALLLVCGILAFILFCREPRIIKSETIREKKITVVKYLASNSTVTGATSATVIPGGATSISGASLTITNSTTVTETSTTTVTEKIKEKYSENSIWLTCQGIGIVKDVAPGAEIKIDNYEVGIEYAIFRQEWNIKGGIKLFSW